MKLRYLILIFFLSVCGACTAELTGDELYTSGMEAFDLHNYQQATDLFNQSVIAYDLEGSPDEARNALLMKNRAFWMLVEMDLNTTQAREALAAGLPNLSFDERERYLDPGSSIQIFSDGEMRYFSGIARNAAYHNITLMQEISRGLNHSAFFDEIYPLITEDQMFDGRYGNPHTFLANSTLSLPREYLPAEGILQVWIPLPIEMESQKNITILNLEPAGYVISDPVTTGDLGQVYFEIPLSEMTGPYLNISADYQFTTLERRFAIDPGMIEPYDLESDLYLKYTTSQPNIEITPEITDLAKEIVGDETNPYLMAKKIYDYIITTYPYSTVPHTYLAASETPESTFMYETGYGDCGTQSMLFAALCRSLGIPARAAGGYQLVPGIAGPHFWAEFYLPGYGWIPVDVTIAESADWAFDKTDEERDRFKDYFFGNLDPYRYTIQNDVDIPFSPDPGDDTILEMVHQTPLVVCNESREDVELLGLGYRTIFFSELMT